MSVTRRSFLAALIGAATLDPERLLWVPGKKLISIPKPRTVRATLLTGDIIGRELDAVYREALIAFNNMIDRWNQDGPHWPQFYASRRLGA